MERPTSDSLKSTRPQVNMEKSPTRCPFCHEGFGGKSETVVCDDCLSRHHSVCWNDHGACSSCESEHHLSRQVRRKGPTVNCASCGVVEENRRECPNCKQDCCERCFQTRFRSCVDCAAELMTVAEEMAIISGRQDMWSFMTCLSLISVLGLSCGFFTGVDGNPFFTMLGAFSIAGLFWSIYGIVASTREAAPLRLKLAPYPVESAVVKTAPSDTDIKKA